VLLLRSSKSLKHTHDAVLYYTYYHMFRPPALLLLLLFSCLLCVFELCSWSLRCHRQRKSFQCAVETANHFATKPKETERERRESKTPPQPRPNSLPPKNPKLKTKKTTHPPKNPKIGGKKKKNPLGICMVHGATYTQSNGAVFL
jgi:hypothetical protein